MAASAWAKFGPRSPDDQGPAAGDDQRERIALTPATINKTARRCAELLADTIYMRGRFPSAVMPAGEINPDAILGGVQHDRSSLGMVTATAGMCQFKLDERAAFYRRDVRSRSDVQVSCPKDLAQRLLDAATELAFRQCSGIVAVPLFIDGEIIATPGYHAPTGRVIAFNGPLPAVPERPTKADALAALDVLLRPFRGYLLGDDP